MISLSMHAQKWPVEWSDGQAVYSLPTDSGSVCLNDYLGAWIEIESARNIFCQACGKKTRKSYGQGHCYPCFSRLARCDRCFVSPEQCHFDQGTCREPDWAQTVCWQPHLVYLANSSGLKVGITRETQQFTRWIDQGASQALVMAKVASRRLSGEVEAFCRQQGLADKTNWRRMLSEQPVAHDLQQVAEDLAPLIQQRFAAQFGTGEIDWQAADSFDISYPVRQYPTKVVAQQLDKQDVVSGRLMGIKGQYWILDSGVFNWRRHTGYQLTLRINDGV